MNHTRVPALSQYWLLPLENYLVKSSQIKTITIAIKTQGMACLLFFITKPPLKTLLN